MSTYMKDLNGQKLMAFKVIAQIDNQDEPVAEFIFDSLKEATKFEAGMRDKDYKTLIERIYV